MKLSVIAPCYNEEESLDKFYQWNKEVLEKLNYEYEIVLVNDGSSDRTGSVLDALAAKDDKVKVIHFRRNFGQTAAMMAGIDHASGDIIIPMDSDLQNDPKDIPRLLEKMEEGYEVVSGWRKDRKDNALKRNLPSRIANWLISKISGVNLHDYGCSLKAYRKDVIKGIKLYGEMHRFIPIYASWFGAKVTEIPVTHHARRFGTSKYGINRTIKVVLDLIVIKFLEGYSQKPIYLFGGFGFFSFFLSFMSAALMFYFKFWGGKSYIQTPLPQLVVTFALIGFLSILIGLVAEMLNRTYHESQNKPVYIVKNTKNLD
jgi:glycosyltransferase involved in cell wall biosynthesis